VVRAAFLTALTICACSSETPTTPGPNPPRLWLAGINGSESNLQLVGIGPPDPF